MTKEEREKIVEPKIVHKSETILEAISIGESLYGFPAEKFMHLYAITKGEIPDRVKSNALGEAIEVISTHGNKKNCDDIYDFIKEAMQLAYRWGVEDSRHA